MFCINTPAQAHTWRYVIDDLSRKGHNVQISARDYGSTIELLTAFKFQYDSFKPITRRSIRLLEIIVHIRNGRELCKKFKPTIIIGFGVDAAIEAVLLGKPCIVFTDSEPVGIQNTLIKIFSDAIITPARFNMNLGKKQLRINSFKELAYLHPSYFQPDPSIYDELNIKREEKYVILRFNVFDAVHDIGRHGFSRDDQCHLLNEISKYAHVFISPEAKLPDELEKYRLPIAYNRIHHALYYATLLVTDTGTMATEAAVLGTPVILCLSNYMEFGNFLELEQKYALLYAFDEPKKAIDKAVEVIQQTDLKGKWAKKREKLLADKIDVTQFMVDFIENYPDSFQNYKNQSKKR